MLKHSYPSPHIAKKTAVLGIDKYSYYPEILFCHPAPKKVLGIGTVYLIKCNAIEKDQLSFCI